MPISRVPARGADRAAELENGSHEENASGLALRHKPACVCIVPRKARERTTEGRLEVAREETVGRTSFARCAKQVSRVKHLYRRDNVRNRKPRNRIGRSDRAAHRWRMRTHMPKGNWEENAEKNFKSSRKCQILRQILGA